MFRSIFFSGAIAMALAFSTAHAGDSQILINTNAQEIIAQQQQIRADAEAGQGRYRDMDAPTMKQLREHQDVVLGLLEGHERSTELSREDQMTVFNSLEAISAILNRAEDDRMICRRERSVGSRFATEVCRTVAERRADSKEARDKMLERGQLCAGPSCSPDSSWRGGN